MYCCNCNQNTDVSLRDIGGRVNQKLFLGILVALKIETCINNFSSLEINVFYDKDEPSSEHFGVLDQFLLDDNL